MLQQFIWGKGSNVKNKLNIFKIKKGKWHPAQNSKLAGYCFVLLYYIAKYVFLYVILTVVKGVSA